MKKFLTVVLVLAISLFSVAFASPIYITEIIEGAKVEYDLNTTLTLYTEVKKGFISLDGELLEQNGRTISVVLLDEMGYKAYFSKDEVEQVITTLKYIMDNLGTMENYTEVHCSIENGVYNLIGKTIETAPLGYRVYIDFGSSPSLWFGDDVAYIQAFISGLETTVAMWDTL